MNIKIQSSHLIKPTKKDTLWNLSELLAQKTIASPQKVIQKKLLPTHHLARTTITPELDAKFQNNSKKSHRNQLKINFQFERLKSSFKQQRSQILLKRSLTFNHKLSTQKLKTSLQNQFQKPNHHRTDSFQNLHTEKSYKSQQFYSNKIYSSKNANLRDCQIILVNKYPRQSHKSESVDFQNGIGFSTQTINPQIRPLITKKKSFLKKGTSLQKQIVVNLLKNKLIKQHEFETQKQYSTKEVLDMIKLYKGFHKDERNKQYAVSSQNKKRRNIIVEKNPKEQFCPLSIVNKFKKPIQGWQIEPEMQIQ